MSRSGSYRSIAPIRPRRPYETRSPSSTCAGRPDPSRPATYFTSGEYITISLSRSSFAPVRRYSSQRLRVSTGSTTVGREYELAARSPQRGPGEAAHPGRDRRRGHGDRPAPGGGRAGRDPRQRERQHREERRERHAAIMPEGAGLHLAAAEPRGVAQLAEHRSPKPGVAGSSPVAPVAPAGVVRPGPGARAREWSPAGPGITLGNTILVGKGLTCVRSSLSSWRERRRPPAARSPRADRRPTSPCRPTRCSTGT